MIFLSRLVPRLYTRLFVIPYTLVTPFPFLFKNRCHLRVLTTTIRVIFKVYFVFILHIIRYDIHRMTNTQELFCGISGWSLKIVPIGLYFSRYVYYLREVYKPCTYVTNEYIEQTIVPNEFLKRFFFALR